MCISNSKMFFECDKSEDQSSNKLWLPGIRL